MGVLNLIKHYIHTMSIKEIKTNIHFGDVFRKHDILITNWYTMIKRNDEWNNNVNSKLSYQESNNFNYVIGSATKKTNKLIGKQAILRSRLVRNMQKETIKLRNEP